jgi:peptide/nickel transport system permease protein
MKNKLLSMMARQFHRPLYAIAMILLGLPTFVVGSIAYLVFLSGHKSGEKECRRQALDEMKKSGRLEQIRQENEVFVKNKYEFFKKDIGSREYNSELEKLVKADIDRELSVETAKRMKHQGKSKNPGFMPYLTGKLGDSNVLLALSIISSLPMYLLVFLCLSPFIRYAIGRVFLMIFVVFGVVLLVFTILHFSSNDPAQSVLGEYATEESIAEFNATYGLDKSYPEQLFTWFKRLVTFDLGKSYSGNENVYTSLMRKFPTTLSLALWSTLLGVVIALPLGIFSSLKPNSGIDYAAVFIALILMSIPTFWLGMILILQFSIRTRILPGTFTIGMASSYIMPCIVMSCNLLASVTRMTRSSMLEVKQQEYITTARAKGLSEKRVVLRHMFPNALIPVVTIFGVSLGSLLGGSAVTEKVFTVQGIGNYIISKVFVPDIPVVLSGVVYLAIVISLVNLGVDLLYAVIDPRMKASLKNK